MTNNAEHAYLLRVNKLYEESSIARKYQSNGFDSGDIRVTFDGQEVGRVQPIRNHALTMNHIRERMAEAMTPFVRMPNTERTRAALLGTVNRQLEDITPVGIDYTTNVVEEDGNYTVQVEYAQPLNRVMIDVEINL
jgi:hypothetical protein